MSASGSSSALTRSGPGSQDGSKRLAAQRYFSSYSSLHGLRPSLTIAALPVGHEQSQRDLYRTLQHWFAGPSGNYPLGGGRQGGDGGGGGGSQPLATVAAAKEPVILTLASFAVTKLAYVRATKAFRDVYHQRTGQDVRFRLTFAASGVQARAVIDGLPADMVALALALDIDKIAEAGLIRPEWRNRFPNNSVVCETTVAFVVRNGNPKNITSWDDLTRPGVQIVLANPKTAGVARWIFLALWGAKMKKGDAASREYVTKVFENVIVQPRDAREASDVFYKQKVGDVLLTYENEVILTNQIYGDKALPYLVPHYNIRIECPLTCVDKVIQSRGPTVVAAAEAFAEFLFTAPAQREFAKLGFRINPRVCKEVASQQVGLPPARLWQVDKELGSWAKAQKKFFDAGQILDAIQSHIGNLRAEKRKAQAAAR